MSQIDGSEETRGDDGLISDFIRQIDALPSTESRPVVPGGCIDLLQRWMDIYGGSTCDDEAEQQDMNKLEFDTGLWLSFGPYPAELPPSEIAEPRGCPTPGACSCPGTIPDAERKKVMDAHMLAESIVARATVATPRTDELIAHIKRELSADGCDSDHPYYVLDLAARELRTLERELIDLKQRLLPQYKGRAERAEKNRDALLEQLIAAQKVISGMTAGVSEWAQAWRESK